MAYASPRVSVVIVVSRDGAGVVSRLRTLQQHLEAVQPYELIVVLGPLAHPITGVLRRAIAHVTILQTDTPLNVPLGANVGARAASGTSLVLLDQDAEPEDGWLAALVRTADADPDVGVVGSTVLFADGRIRSSGALVWQEGCLTDVANGESASALGWRSVRAVDAVSASSMLVRRSVWEAVGGFDAAYAPGVYHDVDLCFRVREMGLSVLVEPRSRVQVSADPAFAPTDAMRHQHGRRTFVSRWDGVLQAHGPMSSPSIGRALHRARGNPRRVLIVDDFIPDPSLGAGFGRMFSAVVELARAGFAVSHHPTRGAVCPPPALLDCGMTVIDGDLTEYLQRPDTWVDVVIVSRPHNFEPAWAAARAHQPWAQVIYDCEALWWRRIAGQAAVADDRETAARLRADAAVMQAIEIRNIRASDFVVTVSEDERVLVREAGVDPARVFALPPVESDVTPTTAGFHTRRGIGFVAGWMAGLDSPNGDGLTWFLDRVLPIVRDQIPWVQVRVTGRNPPVALLERSDPNVAFEGHVEDLRGFYDQIRVAISPVRFGSGVKLKTVQGIQYGVPTVATSIGAEGLTLPQGAGVHVTDHPEVFARMVSRLLTDIDEWQRSRQALIACVDRWNAMDASASWPRLLGDLYRGRQ